KNQNLLNNGITENNSESSRKGDSHSGKLGIDYHINEKTTIGLSGNFSLRDNNRGEELFYRYFNQPDLKGNRERTTEQNDDATGSDISLDFSRDFKLAVETLMANLSCARSTEDGRQTNGQEFTKPRQLPNRRITDGYEDG